MTSRPPRVAFLTDCYHEMNGVALTSRRFQAFARGRRVPFLCAHPGAVTRAFADDSVQMIELGKSKLAFGVDRDLRFDPAFLANKRFLRRAIEDFQPDIVHVTSPGDCGILGAILAHELHLPLAASWHTNLHEFAGRRLERLLSWIPLPLRTGAANSAERATLRCVLRFYQLAKVLFAPNRELVELLEGSTGRPVFLMRRGVDTTLFNPRSRQRDDRDFVIGYAGRLTPEKNVGLLSSIEQALIASGVNNYRFEIAGHGSEIERLRARLRRAVFHGVLKGERLARAYANMDIFAFPSRTDTYGNVVQEALASGVPAVVTNGGGPKYLVGHGVTGLVTGSDHEFIAAVVELARNPHLHSRLRHSTLASVKSLSWDVIFEDVYAGYDAHFRGAAAAAVVDPAVAALNCGA